MLATDPGLWRQVSSLLVAKLKERAHAPARSSALGSLLDGHTAGMACDTCGGRSFHRARCPLLLSKVRVVTALLSVAVAVGLGVQLLGGPVKVNLVLAVGLLLLGVAATTALSVMQRRTQGR